MAFCADKGMPHSEFLMWEPEDRAKQLAFMAEEGARCQLCGTADWEWEENKFAYTPVQKTCQGCYLKTVAADSDKTMPGTTIELVPTTDRLRATQQLADYHRQQHIREMKAEEERERQLEAEEA